MPGQSEVCTECSNRLCASGEERLVSCGNSIQWSVEISILCKMGGVCALIAPRLSSL